MSPAPRSRLLRLAALLASATIVVAACGAATTSPSAAAPSEAAPGSVAPASADPNFAAATYPVDGEAPCGVEPYTGNLKKITATDQNTVVFDLCGPDVAFLQKIAFALIPDQRHSLARVACRPRRDR